MVGHTRTARVRNVVVYTVAGAAAGTVLGFLGYVGKSLFGTEVNDPVKYTFEAAPLAYTLLVTGGIGGAIGLVGGVVANVI